MRSYISASLSKKLELDMFDTNISVVGINQGKSKVSSIVHANIGSMHKDFQATISFLVLPKITEPLPATQTKTSSLSLPANIKLANPHFDKSSKIDVLLGVDIFWKAIEIEQPYLREYPYLIDSKFGVLVSDNFLMESSRLRP